jgi:predicted N-formylglutamate amidohydrolase
MIDEARVAQEATSRPLLDADEPAPVSVAKAGAAAPFLLVCDHAGAATPRRLARLGLAEPVFATHIAVDIGAADLALRMSETLGATLISQTYSRLVIDCNRAVGHPQSIVGVSDGVEIPGNAGLDAADGQARVEAIHRPYHARISREIDERQSRGQPTVLVCVHSFTPVMGGVSRPWHVGVLHGGASPISDAMLWRLKAEDGLVVGDNEPYAMDGTDFTAPFHAWARGLDVVELEVRQDLLADAKEQARLATLLGRSLTLAREDALESRSAAPARLTPLGRGAEPEA